MSQKSDFLETALLVQGIDAARADELAFMARLLVQATLPHSDPGDVRGWGRSNGHTSLTISPGQYTDKNGELVNVGIPYGSLPRLVLAWLTTEAVRTKSRRIVLGESLSSFMRELGLVPTGGEAGTTARLREQMKRLFAARITASYADGDNYQQQVMDVATDVELWWEPKRADQAAMWESTVTLGERFYTFATSRPVPLDVRVLKALKKSPLGLDLYMFLTYRMSYLKKEIAIPWNALHEQLGAEYGDIKNFARRAKKELRKIKLCWPGLDVATPRGRLVLKPSQPHVPRLFKNEE